MPAYLLDDRIWVIERRAHVVWTREGKRGSKGRIAYEDLVTDAKARARMEKLVRERVAKGFELIDAARSIDAPLYGKPGAAKAKVAKKTGLDVAELHAMLAKSSCETASAWLARFAEITAMTCVWRLLRLSCSIAEDGGEVLFEATFGQGSGSNPDAYDEDGYRVRMKLAPLERDDLEDGVDLDVFADDLGRLSQSKRVALFTRAVEDLEAFAAVKSGRIESAEVERGS